MNEIAADADDPVRGPSAGRVRTAVWMPAMTGARAAGRGRGVDVVSPAGAAVAALLVALTVIGTRLLWVNTTPYLIRALDRRPQQRLRRLNARQRFPSGWAGFRGGVSLAAALPSRSRCRAATWW